MAENSFKVRSENINGEVGRVRNSFFGLLADLRVTTLFKEGLPVKYIPHVVFLTVMGIFYIGNTHYSERMMREIEVLEVEVEELRADFTSLKADYMFSSKQSEVAKKVKELGLEESKTPPNKIIIEEGEY